MVKRILVVIDDSESLGKICSFAREMAKKNQAVVSWLAIVDALGIRRLASDEGNALLEKEKQKLRKRLESASENCRKQNILHESALVSGALGEIIQAQSKTADVLITSSKLKVMNLSLSAFEILSVMAQSACPLLIMPEKAVFPDKVLLIYDGTAAGERAIRLWLYLFANAIPNYYLIHVTGEKTDTFPLLSELDIFLKAHKIEAEILILPGTPEEIIANVADRLLPVLIVGSFSRSNQSVINKMLRSDHPLFIVQ